MLQWLRSGHCSVDRSGMKRKDKEPVTIVLDDDEEEDKDEIEVKKKRTETADKNKKVPMQKEKQEKQGDNKKGKEIIQKQEEMEEDFVNNIVFEEYELPPGGVLKYCKDYLTGQFSSKLMRDLLQLKCWQQGDVEMYGKLLKTPRLQAWMADSDLKRNDVSLYQKNEPLPYSEDVLKLKNHLEKLLGCHFNYVLLNLYRDGKDYIGFHADREAIPKGKDVIASISLGHPRRFVMRSKADKKVKKEFLLQAGSLVVMDGTTQKYWKHAVPKELRVTHPRINLTFRIA